MVGCQVLYIMYRIRPDRLPKDMKLCNAELDEVVDLMKIETLGECELECTADGLLLLKNESSDKYATIAGSEGPVEEDAFFGILRGKYVVCYKAAGGLSFF